MNNFPIVTSEDVPPAATDLTRCFWCSQPIGQAHAETCSTIVKTAKLRLIIEVEHEVCHHWEQEQIERFYNCGSWCADNIIDMIEDAHASNKEKGICFCGSTQVEFIEVTDPNPKRRES